MPRLLEFTDDDFAEAAQTRRVLRGQRDLVFLGDDLGDASLEIEPGGQFLARLIQGIINFLRVHF